MMNKQTQEAFNTNQPVLGILLPQHVNPPNDINLKEHETFLFEAEIAVRMKNTINNVSDIMSPLEDLIDAAAPAIEIANISFKHLDRVNVNDIVAANVSAKYVYLGAFKKLDGIDLPGLKVSVNEKINSYKKSYTLLSEYEKQIRWLIKKAYTEGYEVKKGIVLLAGSISPPVVLQPGEYYVDIESLGYQSLSVR